MEERDEKAAEVKTLSAENSRYRECTGKSAAEMESLSNKATALEVSQFFPLKPADFVNETSKVVMITFRKRVTKSI